MIKKAILLIVIVLNQALISTAIRNPTRYPPSHETASFPLLEQPDGITCGPTSAAMLLQHYGIPATIEGVEARTKTRWFTCKEEAVGLTLPTYLRVALCSYGINATVQSGTVRKLKRYVSEGRLPIVLVRSGQKTWHYVVAVGYDENSIIVADPANGTQRRIASKTFNDAWNFTGNLQGDYYGNDFYATILKKVDVVNVTDHLFVVPTLPPGGERQDLTNRQ